MLVVYQTKRFFESVAYRRHFMNILFPALAIEARDSLRFYRTQVQAIDIDADAVRMRSRHVIGLDSAVATEDMLRHTGIKRINLNVILSADQPETVRRHEQMQVARHTADAAITIRYFEVVGRIDFEAHATAMTAAGMSRHDLPPSSFFQTTIWLFAGAA
jgi:hypothetical protein